MFRAVTEWLENPPVPPEVVAEALEDWKRGAVADQVAHKLRLAGRWQLYQLREALGWPRRHNYPFKRQRMPVTWTEAELKRAEEQWYAMEPAKVIAATLHLSDRRQVYTVASTHEWAPRRGVRDRSEWATVRERVELRKTLADVRDQLAHLRAASSRSTPLRGSPGNAPAVSSGCRRSSACGSADSSTTRGALRVPRPRFVPPHLRTGTEESTAVRRVLLSTGWRVYSTSDPRMRRATKGILDLIAFKPGRVLFWDSKAGRGELTQEQREFREAALEAGAEVGSGDSMELVIYLSKRGAPNGTPQSSPATPSPGSVAGPGSGVRRPPSTATRGKSRRTTRQP
jgi:hypothetical protein